MTVYCLGDSWTTGFGVNPSECWVRLVSDQTGFAMINAGQDGDTTDGMRRRLSHATGMDRRENFDALFFLGGGNDILNECRDDRARQNVIKILDYAREKNIRLVLATVFPFVPDIAEKRWVHGKDYHAINEVMESYAKWLRKTALDRELPFADLWTLIANLGQERRHEISLDGIHLKPEGHRILAEFIAARLKTVARDTLQGQSL